MKKDLSIEEVKKILKKYSEKIQASKNLFDGILKEKYIVESGFYDIDIFKDSVKRITKGILDTIDNYLDGYPSKAYIRMSNAVRNDKNFDRILSSRVKTVDKGSLFYRLRYDADKYFDFPLTPIQLFHVPFHKRHLIKAQRFSIPGYPCLYLSTTVFTACKEMDIDNIQHNIREIKIAAFRNNAKLRIVDLAAKDISILLKGLKELKIATLDDKLRDDIYSYGILFPLIAACHTKIKFRKKTDSHFKPEYIIPQIILQWFKVNKEMVDGIKYFCNRVNKSEKNGPYDLHNFVFPVQKSKVNGFCDKLSIYFNGSLVINAKKFTFKKSKLEERFSELQTALRKSAFVPLK